MGLPSLLFNLFKGKRNKKNYSEDRETSLCCSITLSRARLVYPNDIVPDNLNIVIYHKPDYRHMPTK